MLHVIIEFCITPKRQCWLKTEVRLNNELLPLKLSEFLMKIYQKEQELEKNELEFVTALAKLIKKVTLNRQDIYAIINDADLGMFFDKAMEYQPKITWRYERQLTDLYYTTQIPFTFVLESSNNTLIVSLKERDELRRNPWSWFLIKGRHHHYYFSNGVLIEDVPPVIEALVDDLSVQTKKYISGEDILPFIETVYLPSKSRSFWQITTDLNRFIPIEVAPTPVLNLEYEEPLLKPTIQYQYDNIIIDADYDQTTIYTRGKLIKRMPEMEQIYQDDLIRLFTEKNCAALLSDPESIARFLTEIIPELQHRDWSIQSNIPDFKISSSAIDLEFKMESMGNDWFHFEPNCVIDGENRSLQEIAKLVIQHNGYIKTKKGFVKISPDSQSQLAYLAKLNAFSTGKKFSSQDIVPIISATNVTANSFDTKEMIARIKQFDREIQLKLDPDLNVTLRDYQEAGVKWLTYLHSLKLGGILADDMGLGKTIQAIAFCSQLKSKQPILIIGPTNVVYNWESEIKKFHPTQRVLIYSGPTRKSRLKETKNPHYIITSFGIMKNDIDILSKIPFCAIFVDEAQHIKNPKAQLSKAIKSLNGAFKIALTGTPVENHLQDIWSIMDFVMPGYLGTFREFDALFNEDNMSFLKHRVSPFILRRVKEDVLSSLPEKTETIIKCPLTKEQEALYEAVLEASKKGFRQPNGRLNKLSIFAALLKLRQICIEPNLIEGAHYPKNSDTKLGIVQEKIMNVCDEGHKVVVFSQFTKVLNMLQPDLKKENLYIERIDGAVTGKNRMEAVERFQKHKGSGVFLISLKAGGVGINLTAADYVFHIDPWWNPAAENQATDRVHRFGQQNKVMVYKFITQGTIEEKIQELQAKKSALLRYLIETSEESADFGFDELMKSLELI